MSNSNISRWFLNIFWNMKMATGTSSNIMKTTTVDALPLDPRKDTVYWVKGVPFVGGIAMKTTNGGTDTGTTGFGSISTTQYDVTPTGDSTRQVFGVDENCVYNSSFNVSGNGYTCTKRSTLLLQGSGTHAKAVSRLVQAAATGGNVSALLGVESELIQVGPSTIVGNYAAFYCPNLAGVPNIGNVGLFYAYSNDHVGAPGNPVGQPSIMKNQGIYCNGALNELAPAEHPGLVAGRYYGAPFTSLSPVSAIANAIYFIPVYIPHRCNPNKLGVNITTASIGEVVIGLYRSGQSAFPGVVNGVPTSLVAQVTPISTNAVGVTEGTITCPTGYVDAGLYFIGVQFSSTPGITQHNIEAKRISMYGQTTPTDTSLIGYVATAYSPTLPATVGVMSYLAQASEPHAWFRV